MLFRRQLDDDELGALVDNACTEVINRIARRAGGRSLTSEIVDRRLATHSSISSVLADIHADPDRTALLEPLRRALRREISWLLASGSIRGVVSDELLLDVDGVLSPESIDCLMVATGHDIDVVTDVLGEALGKVLARAGMHVVDDVPVLSLR